MIAFLARCLSLLEARSTAWSGTLENRYGGNLIVGSNPTPSARNRWLPTEAAPNRRGRLSHGDSANPAVARQLGAYRGEDPLRRARGRSVRRLGSQTVAVRSWEGTLDVSAWGTGLFSSDWACDVRDTYRELVGEGLSGPEATDRLLELWGPAPDDDDDGPEFWCALAATQWKVGRLEPRVRDRALHVIRTGQDSRGGLPQCGVSLLAGD